MKYLLNINPFWNEFTLNFIVDSLFDKPLWKYLFLIKLWLVQACPLSVTYLK